MLRRTRPCTRRFRRFPLSTGLLALLDDVAAIAKVSAASLDDVGVQAAKAGSKAIGVVIDDAAVTPRYVVGFAAARELPIVGRIALGSLKNKMLFLIPGALALGAFAPWSIMPILAAGGAFLCYEGAEKVLHAIEPHEAHAHEDAIGLAPSDPKALEDARVRGAITTDLVLSGEIAALTLSSVAASSFTTQAAVLIVVGIGITAVVYGSVALIVKADDVGVSLAGNPRPASTFLGIRAGGGGEPSGLDCALRPLTRGFGRGLVVGMPWFLKTLALLGTAAMLWVGGGIVVHALEELGLHLAGNVVHGAQHVAEHAVPAALSGFAGWLAGAATSGVLGLAIGAALIPAVQHVGAPTLRAVKRIFRRG